MLVKWAPVNNSGPLRSSLGRGLLSQFRTIRWLYDSWNKCQYENGANTIRGRMNTIEITSLRMDDQIPWIGSQSQSLSEQEV